jgi:hypothetical protein
MIETNTPEGRAALEKVLELLERGHISEVNVRLVGVPRKPPQPEAIGSSRGGLIEMQHRGAA